MFLISKAVAAAVDISIPCISCNNASGDNPVGLIADFYELALALSGVLALGMIIYAGILRVTSANNPSKVSESNDIIFNALLGIVLLFGAYVLLNTINPELTKLEIPQLSKIEITDGVGSGGILDQKACGSPDPKKPGQCAIEGSQCVLTRNDSTSPEGAYSCSKTENIAWACEVYYDSILTGKMTSIKNASCVTENCNCACGSKCESKWGWGAISAKCVKIKKESCTNL